MMSKRRLDPCQGMGFVLFVSLGMAVVADIFFYGRSLGWAMGLFILLLLAAMVCRRGGRFIYGPLFWLAVALTGLAVSMFYRLGVLAPLLAGGLLATVTLVSRHGWTPDARRWAKRGGLFFILGGFTVVRDVIRLGCVKGAACHWRPRKLHLLGWILPIGLSLIFVFFFAAANPVLESWFGHLADWLKRLELNFAKWFEWLGSLLSPERIIFWAVIFCGVWALLRFRVNLFRRNFIARSESSAPSRYCSDAQPVPPLAKGLPAGFYSPRVAVRCLVLFNIVFLVQTLMDVVYLWGGARLPEGMTHAQYAHRGAYPLVFTTLLAAGLVLMTFRPGGRLQQMGVARRLVYLWLAQNLFLTLSAGWRLKLYVGAFDLTRLRVASAIWMALIFGGVALIIWRIVRGYSNNWLIWANAAMAFGVLYLCALMPFGGWIAEYNVAHCREMTGEGAFLDVEYLYRLGPEAMPALAKVRSPAFDPEMAAKATALRARLAQRLGNQLKDWRGWTWQRASLARRYPAGDDVADAAEEDKTGNQRQILFR